jgi:hypothetical protein
VNLSSMRLTLYPELVAAAIEKDVSDLFVAYTVASRISRSRGACGVLASVELERILVELIGCKERHARDRIRQGDGTFWNLPKKDGRRVGLRAHLRVVNWLAPTFPASKPCEVLFGTLARCRLNSRPASALKLMLMGVLASRNGTQDPISVAYLANSVKHSERSVFRWIKNCPILIVKRNFLPLEDFPIDRYAEAKAEMERRHCDPSLDLQRWKGAWVLCKQLPNSYEAPCLKWLGWRQRTRPLKHLYAVREPHIPDKKLIVLYEEADGTRFLQIARVDSEGKRDH